MFADRLSQWTDRLTVTIKPTWICNLRCSYCYQGRSRPARGKSVMGADVLEASIRAASHLPIDTVDFQWIGGETLAPGVSFYENALELTERYAHEDGPEIIHWFQTNLTLINEKWIEFLKKNDERVVLSVSYDFFEDYFLKTQANGERAARHQWSKIQNALELLKTNDIEFGCLTTIDGNALQRPAEEWFDRWVEQDIRNIGLQLDYADVYSFANGAERGHPWRKYAEFLGRLFTLQEAYNTAHPQEPIILRESLYLYNKVTGVRSDGWVGSCHHMAELCGHFFWTIDVDGEVYGMCDAFMTEEVASKYRLGNVLSDDLAALKLADRFCELTEAQYRLKQAAACRKCPVYQLCNGGCPAFKSHGNFLEVFDDQSVYCEYTRAYFDHILNVANRQRIRNIYDGCGLD